MAVVCPIGEKKRSLEGFELEMGQDVKGIFFFFFGTRRRKMSALTIIIILDRILWNLEFLEQKFCLYHFSSL